MLTTETHYLMNKLLIYIHPIIVQVLLIYYNVLIILKKVIV